MEAFLLKLQKLKAFIQQKLQYFQENYPRLAKLTKGIAIAMLVGWILVVGLILAVYFEAFEKLPHTVDLQQIDNAQASEIYAEGNVLIGKYYVENRTSMTLDNISPNVINALIATEDVRFYKHGGIDFIGLIRVAFKTLLLQKESSGGGSTISQQLVKNLYPRQRHGLFTLPVGKIKEMIVAQRIEAMYPKDKILELYLNTVPFGGNVFGIEAAAKRFFRKTAGDLQAQEAALLIGMLKATTYYNPRLHSERAKDRRDVVLGQMAKYDYLTAEEAEKYKALPLKLNYTSENHNEGLATYFREQLRLELVEWCKKHLTPDGRRYNLYTDGLKIHTTLNETMQRIAEEAVEEHMTELQNIFNKHWDGKMPWGNDTDLVDLAVRKSDRYSNLRASGLSPEDALKTFEVPREMSIFHWEGNRDTVLTPLDSVKYYIQFLHAGFLAMQPSTGKIKVWVGGIKHRYFKYDHITSTRQVGSTFKPLVYANALESGIPPCEYIENYQRTYELYDDWTPGNADGEYGGQYSLMGGLVNSINTVSAELIMISGIDKVVNLAKAMGVKSEIPEVPSLALGTAELSLMEMVEVYGTFANLGKHILPVYLECIEDRNGNVIASFEDSVAPADTLAFSEATAYEMQRMLQEVTKRGTATRLRTRYKLWTDIAGKTGTTQDQTDGWFMGFTPDLVAGVWVGGADNRVRFRSLSMGQGASTALPIFGKFFQKLYETSEFKPWEKSYFKALPDTLDWAMDCPMFIPSDSIYYDTIYFDNNTYSIIPVNTRHQRGGYIVPGVQIDNGIEYRNGRKYATEPIILQYEPVSPEADTSNNNNYSPQTNPPINEGRNENEDEGGNLFIPDSEGGSSSSNGG
ncbi:MAG: transglycosylase domain-containing protein [Chitinophagales bacterium]